MHTQTGNNPHLPITAESGGTLPFSSFTSALVKYCKGLCFSRTRCYNPQTPAIA